MKKYELTYLLNPNLEEIESSKEDIVEAMEKQGADLDNQTEPEEIELGASIKPKLGKKRLEEALMGTVEFHSDPSKVNNLKDKIAQKKEVLRVMLIEKEEAVEHEHEKEPVSEEEKKVELEDIDQKLDEILEE